MKKQKTYFYLPLLLFFLLVSCENDDKRLRSELVILRSEIENKDLVNDSLIRVVNDLSLKKIELEELLSSDPINFSQEINYTDKNILKLIKQFGPLKFIKENGLWYIFSVDLEEGKYNLDGGVTLISTSGGTYTGITSGGNPVATSAFDGWIIGIKNPGVAKEDGSYGDFSSDYKGIMSQVGETLYNGKPSVNNSELVFNISSSTLYVKGEGDVYTDVPVKLVTPDYFDTSLDLTFKTLSQGGAGDVATSTAIDRSVHVYSAADGFKNLEVTGLDKDGNIGGVEDGGAIRLSV